MRTVPPLAASRLAPGDRLEVDAAAHELGVEHVDDLLADEVARRVQRERLLGLAELDRRARVLEVVALHELLGRLLVGVVDLLQVDLGDDVEAVVLGHGSSCVCVNGERSV